MLLILLVILFLSVFQLLIPTKNQILDIMIFSLILIVIIYMNVSSSYTKKCCNCNIEYPHQTSNIPETNEQKTENFRFEVSPCKLNCHGKDCCFKPYFEYTSDAMIDRGYKQKIE